MNLKHHPTRPEYVECDANEASDYHTSVNEGEEFWRGWPCFDCFDARKRKDGEDWTIPGNSTRRVCENSCGQRTVWVRYTTMVLMKLEDKDEPA